jgi:hypothetical protein
MDLSLKTDIVENIAPRDFNSRYFNPQIPVIIKGLANNTTAGEKWTIDYFKETMGELVVDIYDNGNKKASATAYTNADLKMKFSDYLDIISKDEHTDLRIFLCNLFKHNPKLREEFPCPEIFRGMLDHMGFMFFGGKNTTVRIHYDIDMSNVLHTHFGGKKRVVLISPAYSRLLYRLPLNTYSLIDIDNPDYTKFPALKYVKGYDLILDPGDSIFMPAGYWHYMTYLEGSFSVSYRKLSPFVKHAAEGLVNLGVYMPIDKTLNRLFGQTWLKTKTNIAESHANTIMNTSLINGLRKSSGL